MDIQWGDKIAVNEKYVRVYENGMKIWKSVKCDLNNCIYLGTRTLSNGSIRYSWDDGTDYRPTTHFPAAIICPSDKHNPIYVPINAMVKL